MTGPRIWTRRSRSAAQRVRTGSRCSLRRRTCARTTTRRRPSRWRPRSPRSPRGGGDRAAGAGRRARRRRSCGGRPRSCGASRSPATRATCSSRRRTWAGRSTCGDRFFRPARVGVHARARAPGAKPRGADAPRARAAARRDGHARPADRSARSTGGSGAARSAQRAALIDKRPGRISLASDAHAPSVRAIGMRAAAEAVGDAALAEWLTVGVPGAIVDGAPHPRAARGRGAGSASGFSRGPLV